MPVVGVLSGNGATTSSKGKSGKAPGGTERRRSGAQFQPGWNSTREDGDLRGHLINIIACERICGWSP